MDNVKLLINIVRRDLGTMYMDFYEKNGVETVFCSLCAGTAGKHLLDYLGVEDTEKLMFTSVVFAENARRLMRGFVTEMGIDVPGSGIAAVIPMGSVGGASCMKYLTEGQDEGMDEEKRMEDPAYALLVVIAENGYTDMVMDAARSAGARGGTVVHARGTGSQFTSKFLGVSIAAEKEMIYIVTKAKDKSAIMKAIMDQAGMHTQAKAAVFSVPVEEVAGLRSVTE